MTLAAHRPPQGRGPTEKAFMAQVTKLATLLRWRVYHTHDSRRSTAGFPDLILLRGEQGLAIELKAQRGKLKPEQAAWLDAFRAAGFLAAVWRPTEECWREIENVLKGEG